MGGLSRYCSPRTSQISHVLSQLGLTPLSDVSLYLVGGEKQDSLVGIVIRLLKRGLHGDASRDPSCLYPCTWKACASFHHVVLVGLARVSCCISLAPRPNEGGLKVCNCKMRCRPYHRFFLQKLKSKKREKMETSRVKNCWLEMETLCTILIRLYQAKGMRSKAKAR